MNKVLVVGDLITDVYLTYSSVRTVPDHPKAPVLVFKSKTEVIGGAGNVVENIKAMGGSARLVDDSLCRQAKTRIMLEDQMLCRIDKKEPVIGPLVWPAFVAALAAEKPDVIVLSDYAAGTLKDPQQFIRLAKDLNVPVLVDPKQHDWSVYDGATLIKPNAKEWVASKNQPDCTILVSDGSRGIYLVEPKADWEDGFKMAINFPAVPVRNAVDPCGCGDSVIACLATFWGRMPLHNLINLANKAGAIAVTKKGTVPVTLKELNIC